MMKLAHDHQLLTSNKRKREENWRKKKSKETFKPPKCLKDGYLIPSTIFKKLGINIFKISRNETQENPDS